jgi:diguanylate cyclase (GGDEF)-like protein
MTASSGLDAHSSNQTGITTEHPQVIPVSFQARKVMRQDLVLLFCAVTAAVISVLLFDTGSLAEWIARHKDTKIDEVIVVGMVLVVGLAALSIRRWLELSTQLVRYEELYREMNRLNRESSLLGELGDLLQSCLSSDEAHTLITDRARVLFPGSSGAVCVTANSRDLVEVLASWGEPALVERFFPPKDCWALRRGRFHLLQGDLEAMSCTHVAKPRPQWAMCVPMMAHGETLGILYFDSQEKHGQNGHAHLPLSDSTQRLAKTLAEHAALALANLKLRETLRMQSVRDPLTGLYNRRYMEESLDRELRRSMRKKSHLGVMMLDIDHFKRVNDTFGHEAGDAVLQTVANFLRSQLRGEDVVCRYGGEEFTLILPEASIEGTHQRAQQLREAVKRAIPSFRGQRLEAVNLSIGVAAFPENGTTGEELLRTADSALYQAKQQGRDRVVVAASV